MYPCPFSHQQKRYLHVFGEYLAHFEQSLFFATNTRKCLGVDRKGGTILIGKDRTLKEQAVLKRKRRNNTAWGMEHDKKTNGGPSSKEQY